MSNNPFVRTAVLRLVNRVVDADGKCVPQEYMVGGQAFWIHEYLDVPEEYAPLIIHQSMFKIDPATHQGEYRLGCSALGVSESTLTSAEVDRPELTDRDLVPSHRRKTYVRIHNPIRRHDHLNISDPRDKDGAFAGEFGNRKTL